MSDGVHILFHSNIIIFMWITAMQKRSKWYKKEKRKELEVEKDEMRKIRKVDRKEEQGEGKMRQKEILEKGQKENVKKLRGA